MNLFNKIKWVLGILLIFSIIYATNQIDKNNFAKVQNSVETIYTDRLVAKDLIINFTRLLHQKEIAVVNQDEDFFATQNESVNDQINGYLKEFKETELTKKEARILQKFEKSFEDLKQAENELFLSSDIELGQSIISKELTSLKDDLGDLSKIQIEEGKRQMMIGRKAMDNMNFFSKIEIYLMAALAIGVQLLILYQPKKPEKFEGF